MLSAVRLTLPVISLILLSGCIGNVVYPVADGYHRQLPTKEVPLVIWGDNSTATGTATTWFLQRGFRLVERAKLDQILQEQRITLTNTPEDKGQILRVGQLVGAQQIVFLESKITSQEEAMANFSMYGGGSRRYTTYNIGLSVRGIDVESGEIQWSGLAHYGLPISSLEQGIVGLTCYALENAWLTKPTKQDVEDACHLSYDP